MSGGISIQKQRAEGVAHHRKAKLSGWRIALLVLSAVFGTNCYSPDVVDCAIACGDKDECPDDTHCDHGFCTAATSCEMPAVGGMSSGGNDGDAGETSVGGSLTGGSGGSDTGGGTGGGNLTGGSGNDSGGNSAGGSNDSGGSGGTASSGGGSGNDSGGSGNDSGGSGGSDTGGSGSSAGGGGSGGTVTGGSGSVTSGSAYGIFDQSVWDGAATFGP